MVFNCDVVSDLNSAAFASFGGAPMAGAAPIAPAMSAEELMQQLRQRLLFNQMVNTASESQSFVK